MYLWALQKFKSTAKVYCDTYSAISRSLTSFCDTRPLPLYCTTSCRHLDGEGGRGRGRGGCEKGRRKSGDGRRAGNEAVLNVHITKLLHQDSHYLFVVLNWVELIVTCISAPYIFQQHSRAIEPRSGTIQPKRTAAYTVRRTRLYHNCKLLAPDGQHLSTIDKRKLEWYLQKGLGSEL